jgi:tetratricopeptide (TPR) repeat protein
MYSAVQLFLQSARRTDVGFSPNAADLAAVARICQLVEGVPLGIELAAAWVRMLSCQAIATEIEANLDFLTTSLRDVPARHRSLRAVFAQSWALLSGDGRACFRKLAVFRGGFTREAAEDVAGASLAALSSLMDKSLLHRTSTGRYDMLEVLRQYAEERLGAVPRESDVVRDRHCEHYLALLRRLEPSLKGAQQKAALDELGREMENLRVAWRWASARGKVVQIAEAATSLFLFYDIRSRFQEGAEMFREAATALSEPGTGIGPAQRDEDSELAESRQALLGLLLVVQGWFLQFFEPAESQAALERGLETLEPLGPRRELAFANILCLYVNAWSPTGLEQKLRESLAIYEAYGDRWGIALAMDALSYVLCAQDSAAAERYAQQSLDLRRQLGDLWGMAMAFYTLAWVAEYHGMLEVAKQRYHESLELRHALGEDLEGVMHCLEGMARVARRMGDYEQARQRYQEGLSLSRERGSRFGIARSLQGLGQVAYDLGEYAEARRRLEECAALHEDMDARIWFALATSTLGDVALALGDYEQALRRFEQSLRIEAHNPWAWLGLGRLSAASGDRAAALGHLGQALRYAVDRHADAVTLETLTCVARLQLDDGAAEQAMELIGFVLNHRALNHRTKVSVEGILARATDLFPPEAVEAGLARGKAHDLETVTEGILGSIG